MLFLSLSMPPLSHTSATDLIVLAIFSLIDSLPRMALHPETTKKLKISRSKVHGRIAKKAKQRHREAAQQIKKVLNKGLWAVLYQIFNAGVDCFGRLLGKWTIEFTCHYLVADRKTIYNIMYLICNPAPKKLSQGVLSGPSGARSPINCPSVSTMLFKAKRSTLAQHSWSRSGFGGDHVRRLSIHHQHYGEPHVSRKNSQREGVTSVLHLYLE